MTFHNILSGVGCVLALSLPALAQTKPNADQAFMKTAARTDMTEAHIGQMAANQASQSRVKDFGQRLIHDHTEAYDQLATLAAKTGSSIPNGIDIRKISAVEQLKRLKGKKFDRQFVLEEIRDHERAIAAFKREAQRGLNPDVKAYASKMIPVLQDHLSQARALARPAKHG